MEDENLEEKLISMVSRKNSLKEGIDQIRNIIDKLDISEETENLSYYIFKKSLENNFNVGRNKNNVVCSALYIACKLEKEPIFLKEIAEASGQPENKIFNTYRSLVKQLEIKIEPIEPEKFISKIIYELDLTEKTEKKAKEIIGDIRKMGYISGKSPQGIAAGTVYFASILCNEKRTQQEIAEVAQVSQNTVRNHYKKISSILQKR